MKVDWKSFRKKHTPEKGDKFPTGTRFYIGSMGKGKTLSMVHYVHELKEKYPQCRIFSNVVLKDLVYYHIKDDLDLKKALEYENGEDGVLVLIDEAHILMNRKTGTSLDMITAISMQRKDRKRIIMATQRWASMDIDSRRQVDEVVEVHKFWKFQYNLIFHGETVRLDPRDYSFIMDLKDRELFKHNDEYYNRYDTFQRFHSNAELIDSAPAAPPIVVQQQDGKKKKK